MTSTNLRLGVKMLLFCISFEFTRKYFNIYEKLNVQSKLVEA